MYICIYVEREREREKEREREREREIYTHSYTTERMLEALEETGRLPSPPRRLGGSGAPPTMLMI